MTDVLIASAMSEIRKSRVRSIVNDEICKAQSAKYQHSIQSLQEEIRNLQRQIVELSNQKGSPQEIEEFKKDCMSRIQALYSHCQDLPDAISTVFSETVDEKNQQIQSLQDKVEQIHVNFTSKCENLNQQLSHKDEEMAALKAEHQQAITEANNKAERYLSQLEQFKGTKSQAEKDVSDLMTQNSEKAKRIRELEGQLGEYNQQINKLTQENMANRELSEKAKIDFQNQLSELSQQLSQSEQKYTLAVSHFNQEKASLQSQFLEEKNNLQESLNSRNETIQTLKLKVDELTNTVQSLTDEKQKISANLISIRTEHDNSQEVISTIRSQLQSTNNELDIAQKELETLKIENSNNAEKVSDLTIEVNGLRAQLAQSESAKSDAESIISRQKEGFTSQINKLRSQLTDSQAEVVTFQEKVRVLEQELTSKDGEIYTLKSQGLSNDEAAKQLKDANIELTEKSVILSKDNEMLKLRVDSLGNALASMKEELAKSQADKESLQKQTCDLQQKIEILSNELGEAQQKVARLTEDLEHEWETAKATGSDLEKKNTDLKAEIARLKDDNTSLVNQYANAMQTVTSQSESLKLAEQEKAKLEKQIADDRLAFGNATHEEIEKLQTIISTQENEISQLKKSIDEYSEKCQEINGKLNSSLTEINTLTDQLSSAQSEHQSLLYYKGEVDRLRTTIAHNETLLSEYDELKKTFNSLSIEAEELRVKTSSLDQLQVKLEDQHKELMKSRETIKTIENDLRQKKNEVKQLAKSKKADLVQMDLQIATLGTENQNLKIQITKLSEENDHLQKVASRVEGLEREISILKPAAELSGDFNEEVFENHKTIQLLLKEKTELVNSITNLQQELNGLQQGMVSIEEYNAIERANQSLTSQLTHLKHFDLLKQLEIYKEGMVVGPMNEEILELQKANDDLRRQLSEVTKSAQTVNTSLTEKDTRISELINEIDYQKSIVHVMSDSKTQKVLQEKIDSLASEVTRLQGELSTKDSQIQSLCTQFESERQSFSNPDDKIRESFIVLKREYDSLQKVSKENEAIISSQKEAQSKNEAIIESLRQEISQQQDLVNAQQKDISIMVAENQRLSIENEEMVTKLHASELTLEENEERAKSEAESILSQNNEKIESLRSQIEELQREKDMISLQLEEAQGTAEHARNEVSRLRGEIEKMQKQIEKRQLEEADLRGECEVIKADKTQLEIQLSNSRQKVNELTEKIAEFDNEKSRLNHEFEQKTKDLREQFENTRMYLVKADTLTTQLKRQLIEIRGENDKLKTMAGKPADERLSSQMKATEMALINEQAELRRVKSDLQRVNLELQQLQCDHNVLMKTIENQLKCEPNEAAVIAALARVGRASFGSLSMQQKETELRKKERMISELEYRLSEANYQITIEKKKYAILSQSGPSNGASLIDFLQNLHPKKLTDNTNQLVNMMLKTISMNGKITGEMVAMLANSIEAMPAEVAKNAETFISKYISMVDTKLNVLTTQFAHLSSTAPKKMQKLVELNEQIRREAIDEMRTTSKKIIRFATTPQSSSSDSPFVPMPENLDFLTPQKSILKKRSSALLKTSPSNRPPKRPSNYADSCVKISFI